MRTKVAASRVSLKEYAEKHNPMLNRRNQKMSWAYLYRLIRQDAAGESTRPLWFKYEFEGPKARIWVLLK